MTDNYFDPVVLKADAYADSGKFRARTDIYRYQLPRVDFVDWALSHLPGAPGAVLDVGCGPGNYVRRLTGGTDSVIGIDFSLGMLGEARVDGAHVCAGDAQALPFVDRTFDTTLCMHVLYHVPDIDQAIGELHRVTKRGGTVVVATNGSEHQRVIRETFDSAVGDVSGTRVEPVLSSARRFRLEDAEAMLRARFDSVERHDLPRELVIPEVAPVVGYIESVRSFHEANLPKDVRWDDVVVRFAQRVQEQIEGTGAFRTSVHAGVVVCRSDPA